MYPYRYHRPGTVAEAERLLASDAEARPLAGGMSLIPVMKHRLAAPSDLVDLAALGDLVGVSAEAGVLTIGAMTRHATVAASETVREVIPALGNLAGGIGGMLGYRWGNLPGRGGSPAATCSPTAPSGSRLPAPVPACSAWSRSSGRLPPRSVSSRWPGCQWRRRA